MNAATAATADTIWRATALAQDESSIKAAALSVRQRKLLALLSTPMSVDALSSMSGLAHPEVELNLSRFVKLGLAQLIGGLPATPAQLRASSFVAGKSSSAPKTSFIVGGVGLAAVACAIAWFMRAPAASPPVSAAPVATREKINSPAPLVLPGDVATTNVFVSGAPDAAAALGSGASVAANSPASSATTVNAKSAVALSREAAAGDAAKSAKQSTSAATPISTQTPDSRDVARPASASVATQTPPISAPTQSAAAPVVAAPPTLVAVTPAAPAPAEVTPAAATLAAVGAPRPIAPTASPAPITQAAAVTPRVGALLSRVEPSFPRNADVDRGLVRARLTVNAAGAVTGVDILEANPPRIFDRNVRTALQQWRYEGTGEAQTKLVEVQFNR